MRASPIRRVAKPGAGEPGDLKHDRDLADLGVRALTDPVDRALHLLAARFQPGQRVRDRHAQVVMAMHREDREQASEQRPRSHTLRTKGSRWRGSAAR